MVSRHAPSPPVDSLTYKAVQASSLIDDIGTTDEVHNFDRTCRIDMGMILISDVMLACNYEIGGK
jgi:hypothetical protein